MKCSCESQKVRLFDFMLCHEAVLTIHKPDEEQNSHVYLQWSGGAKWHWLIVELCEPDKQSEVLSSLEEQVWKWLDVNNKVP